MDFLVEDGPTMLPLEVKRASTPRPEFASSLARLRALLGSRLGPGLVITLGGEGPYPLTREDRALPFALFAVG